MTRRLGILFDDSMGIRVNQVVFLDKTGRTYDKRDTVPRDELLGPGVPLAARPSAGHDLSSAQVARPHRAGRIRRHRDLCRRHAASAAIF